MINSESSYHQQFVRPNWREIDRYSHLLTVQFDCIAWEFLRRNPKYQLAWNAFTEQLIAGCDNQEKKDSLTAFINIASGIGIPDTATAGDVPPEPITVLREVPGYLEFSESRYKAENNRQHLAAKPWGLSLLQSPATNWNNRNRPIFLRSGSRQGIVLPHTEGGPATTRKQGSIDPLKTKWLTPIIDLSFPLEVIKKNIIDLITSERKHRLDQGYFVEVTSYASEPKKYIELLRILDADHSTVSIQEIGRVLSPTELNEYPEFTRDNKYRKRLKLAKKIMYSDYQILPTLKFRS